MAAAGVALLVGSAPAAADGLLDRVLNTLQNVAVSSAWAGVDPAVQNCLQSQYNLNPADLASQGVLPSDPRLSEQMDNCQQMTSQNSVQRQPDQPDPQERVQELTQKYGAKAAQKIASGNIDVGFSQDEVAEAWGNPDSRQTSTKGREIWVYGSDKVMFSHGKVSGVGH